MIQKYSVRNQYTWLISTGIRLWRSEVNVAFVCSHVILRTVSIASLVQHVQVFTVSASYRLYRQVVHDSGILAVVLDSVYCTVARGTIC